MPNGETYKSAGVDIEAGDALVDRIKSAARQTYGPRVYGGLGGFAGLFRLDYNEKLFANNYREPLLVACTDGVGSKLLLAAEAARTAGPSALRGVGIDLVAMNVNDLITTGAEPLFFLDYVAVNKLDPAVVSQLVIGIADGCHESRCALLGGETAEMPDLYATGHFDLAGFAVGVVDRRKLINGRDVEPGDVVLGLSSSGVHSNGYALVRRLLFKKARMRLDESVTGLGETLGEALLRPTRIYVAPILNVVRAYRRKRVIKAMAHITGGGLPGNLPRVISDHCDIVIKKESWPIPPIFGLLQKQGVDEEEMYRVFNMGIGYCLIVSPPSAGAIAARLRHSGEQVYRIGTIRRGSGQFVWK